MTLADMFADPDAERRARAAETAREWLAREPYYLDLETSGLDESSQFIQVGVIDKDGRTILNALVQPTVAISPEAIAVHGIGLDVIENLPDATAIMDHLRALLDGQHVIGWNLPYDWRILAQTADALHVESWPPRCEQYCAMRLEAEYAGEYDGHHANPRWHKLVDATKTYQVGPFKAHSAIGDCQATRAILRKMAE